MVLMSRSKDKLDIVANEISKEETRLVFGKTSPLEKLRLSLGNYRACNKRMPTD